MIRRIGSVVVACVLGWLATAQAGESHVTREPTWTTPDGKVLEAMCDLPPAQHVRNIAAPKDGLGNCVWASMDMAARWSNYHPLIGIINKVEYGGGYPEKVEKIIKQFGAGVEVVQYEGNDLAFIELALKTGRIACTTFGYSSRYGGAASIQHMVITVYLDNAYACVIDDNFPGTWEWMTRAEYEWRFRHPNRQGWAYVLVCPPPPPIPVNNAALETIRHGRELLVADDRARRAPGRGAPGDLRWHAGG